MRGGASKGDWEGSKGTERTGSDETAVLGRAELEEHRVGRCHATNADTQEAPEEDEGDEIRREGGEESRHKRCERRDEDRAAPLRSLRTRRTLGARTQ